MWPGPIHFRKNGERPELPSGVWTHHRNPADPAGAEGAQHLPCLIGGHSRRSRLHLLGFPVQKSFSLLYRVNLLFLFPGHSLLILTGFVFLTQDEFRHSSQVSVLHFTQGESFTFLQIFIAQRGHRPLRKSVASTALSDKNTHIQCLQTILGGPQDP